MCIILSWRMIEREITRIDAKVINTREKLVWVKLCNFLGL